MGRKVSTSRTAWEHLRDHIDDVLIQNRLFLESLDDVIHPSSSIPTPSSLTARSWPGTTTEPRDPRVPVGGSA